MQENQPLRQSEQFLVNSARFARTNAQHRRRKRSYFFFLLIVLVLLSGAAWMVYIANAKEQPIHVKYVWVQMLPDEPGPPGRRLVRAIITEGDRCPKILEKGRDVEMVRRSSPLWATFPVLVCEANLGGASDAWIGSRQLPTRPDNPRDVVVIGDTGCRMVYWQIQACLSGVEWPFSAVAVSAAAKIRADGFESIVIHVGDYHYRENPCADRNPECGGSPYGDNWATWEEEFFKPASPLLLAAPWVIMRGNHEDCSRAGAGWIFFFALPGSTNDSACQHELPSYRLAIGRGERQRVLVVLDTANAGSQFGIEARCKIFRQWIDGIDDSNAVVWLALHQPLLSRSPDGKRIGTSREDDLCRQDDTKDALKVIRAKLLASKDPKPKVKLLLSGDLHVFQYFQPAENDKPVQVIAGMGGTKLDELNELLPKDAPKDEKPKAADAKPQWDSDVTSFGVAGGALTIAKHGFVVMHNDGPSWTVTLLDVTGRTLATCYFSETSDTSTLTTALPNCKDNPGRQATAQ